MRYKNKAKVYSFFLYFLIYGTLITHMDPIPQHKFIYLFLYVNSQIYFCNRKSLFPYIEKGYLYFRVHTKKGVISFLGNDTL